MVRFLYLAFVTAVFAFLLLPIGFVVLSSFSASPLLTFPPTSYTLAWYGKIPRGFTEALQTSIIIGLITAAVTAVLGTGIGLALVRTSGKLRELLALLSVAPLTVPHLVLGVAMFHTSLFLFDLIGLQLLETVAGLVMAHAAVALPYVVRGVTAGHAHFDRSLEEAALNLGASRWQTLRWVTLPVLASGIISGAFFAFLVSFDEVPITLFMGGGTTTTTLPLRILTSIEYNMDPDVMAISSLIILASLVIMIAIDRTIGLERFFGAGRA
jgi:putative spermidine/putrescine transport system permease protein